MALKLHPPSAIALTLLYAPLWPLMTLPANAACTLASSTYVCSGTDTTSQSLTGSPLTVQLSDGYNNTITTGTTTTGVNLNLTATNGLSLQALGAATLASTTATSVSANTSGSGSVTIDLGNATVNGNAYGVIIADTGSSSLALTSAGTIAGQTNDAIHIASSGSGAITVNTQASVTSTAGIGISATGGATNTDITFTTGAVRGGTSAITAVNLGTGTTNITATDIVTGGSLYGVNVNTGTTAKDITVTTAKTVTSTNDGINVVTSGSGAIKIDAQAAVTSTNYTGIYTVGSATTTDIIIAATDVSGAHKGITAWNKGTGQLLITATGTVSAPGAAGVPSIDGINAIADATVTGFDIKANNVTGNRGIEATSYGSSPMNITTSGTVEGDLNEGILATNIGTNSTINLTSNIVNSKNNNAITTNNVSGGDSNISVQGAITGKVTGISAISSPGTGTVTVEVKNTATVAGQTSAVAIATGNISQLNNSGTIGSATTPQASVITSAIGVDYAGSTAASKNTLTNLGTITGTTFAIQGGDGQETITHETGILHGTIDLGANNDSFTSRSGTITSTVKMGSGNDTLTLGDTVDITSLPELAGGADSDTLNLSHLVVKGFTAASNDSSGNNSGLGTNLTGWEKINLNDNATLKLTGDLFNTTNKGTLTLTASTLDGRGNSPGLFTIFGDVANAGHIALDDGAADDVTTISGNYVGTGGTLHLDTVLGNDQSSTDKLVILGNASGTTALTISPAGGTGAATDHGIEIITVTGQSTANAFYLTAPVEKGAYVYGLTYYGGADQNWYLTAKLSRNGQYQIGGIGAVYEAGSATALDTLVNATPTLQQRVGQRQWLLHNGDNDQRPIQGLWFRGIGTYSKITPRQSDADLHYSNNNGGFQLGVDSRALKLGNSRLVFGLTGRYISGHAMVRNDNGSGKIKGRSFGAGATMSWYGSPGSQGLYLDSQFMVDRVRQKFESDDFGTLKKHVYRTSFFLSQEAGYRYQLGAKTAVVPQAQFIWGSLDHKSIHDKFDTEVDFKRATSRIGRIGLAYEFGTADPAQLSPGSDYQKAYVIANLLHDFSRHSKVDVSNATLKERNRRSWAEIGLGGSLGWDQNKSFYSEIDYRTKLNGSHTNEGFKATLGFNMKW